MSTIDIIILVVLALFVWKGVKMGLIEAVGGIIGLFVAAFVASRYYLQAADMLRGISFNSDILAKILGFLLVFIVVNRLIAIIFWIIDKVFHIIAIIPFLESINHLLGGIFGLLEGIIFIGILVFVFANLPLMGSFKEKVNQSRFAPALATVGKISQPFMPDNVFSMPFDPNSLNVDEAVQKAKDIFDKLPQGVPSTIKKN